MRFNLTAIATIPADAGFACGEALTELLRNSRTHAAGFACGEALTELLRNSHSHN